MAKKKLRKRSTIRKARNAVLKEADRLQHSTGIDFSRRGIFIGGAKPTRVYEERKKREGD